MIQGFYKKLQETQKIAKIPAIIESSQGAWLTINGVKKLNFCSSHYLGFADADSLKTAVKVAVEKYGVGTGYRTIAGTSILHIELEEALARFKGAEAAIIFTGGYMANCAAIQTILGKEDIVISDELNHASIIDAVRLSQVGHKFIYKHGKAEDLKKQLIKVSVISKIPKSDGELPLVLIVTDGVFSMDGDVAPLPEIVALAKEYGALTMVDDAHGEGVMGKGGRGTVDHFGLHGQIDIEVGTLSKAFSVLGGFITGKKELINYYKQKSRQFMFSNALTVPDTAAIIEGVRTLEHSQERVKKLWENTEYIKNNFKKLGLDIGNSVTPITPVMLKDDEVALNFSTKLMNENVFATAICFPMVAKGNARIRVIPSAAHSRKDLDFGIAAFEKVAKGLKII